MQQGPVICHAEMLASGFMLWPAADGRRQWLSDPGGAVDQGVVDERSKYFVQAIALPMAAFPPSSVTPLAASSLPVLQANVAWRQREQQDVGVLAVRCIVASQVFQRRTITLQRLLKCREPSERCSGGLLGLEVWLPFLCVRSGSSWMHLHFASLWLNA